MYCSVPTSDAPLTATGTNNSLKHFYNRNPTLISEALPVTMSSGFTTLYDLFHQFESSHLTTDEQKEIIANVAHSLSETRIHNSEN